MRSFLMCSYAGTGIIAKFLCPQRAGDVGHAGQVTLDNVADPVWEQREVGVLTGAEVLCASEPPTFARVAECQPSTGSWSLKCHHISSQLCSQREGGRERGIGRWEGSAPWERTGKGVVTLSWLVIFFSAEI